MESKAATSNCIPQPCTKASPFQDSIVPVLLRPKAVLYPASRPPDTVTVTCLVSPAIIMAYLQPFAKTPKPSEGLQSPKAASSHLKGLSVLEIPVVELLKSEPVPPWQQPLRLAYGSHSKSSSGLQCSDFWSQKMRSHVAKSYFPGRVKSKVAASFHSHDREAFQASVRQRGSIISHIVVDLPKLQTLPNVWKELNQRKGRRVGRVSP